VVSVPATFMIPYGTMDGLVDVQAEPVVGLEQSVTIHASYAGRIIDAQVVVLPRASVISGVVTDVASRPLVGAVVVIDEVPMPSGEHMQLSTGPEGAYVTPPVPAGSYQIEVTAGGYRPAGATVSVEEGVPATSADFVLWATLPFTITGTVSDSGGAAIAGAKVTLIQNGTSTQTSVVAGDDGAYRLSGDPGIYVGDYTLLVTQPGYTQSELVLTIPNGATLTENFVLMALGSLSGLVTDGGRTPAAPIAGAEVHAEGAVATTDASGHYEAQVAPGSMPVSISAGGFEVQGTTVTVAPGGVTNQDFVLVEASATLAGTVFDGSSGEPIHGAVVFVAGAKAAGHTQFDGSYTVPGIPAGSASVSVTAQGRVTERSSIVFAAHQSVSMNYYLASDHPDPHPPK
jgi:large repetitive protein